MKTNVVVPGAGVNYYCPNQDGTRSPTVSSRSHVGRPPRRRRPQARSSPRGPASSSLPTQEPLPPPRHAPRPERGWLVAKGAALLRARGCHRRQFPLRLPPHPLFGSGRPRAPRCRGSRQGHALHGHAGPDDPCARALNRAAGRSGPGVGGPLSLPRASHSARGSPRSRLRAPQRSQAWPRGGRPRPVLLRSLVRRLARPRRHGRSCARSSRGRCSAYLATRCRLAPSRAPPLRRSAIAGVSSG